MKENASRQLYLYWNEVRGDRMAPRRFEIEPSRISGILPDSFILEREDPRTARFRLAGTRICEAFAREFRGDNFFDFFAPEDRIAMERQLDLIASQGAVGVFTVEGATASGKCVSFEVFVAPLIHTRECVDRFIGTISPMARPNWLGREAIVTKRLVAEELIWPEGRPHAIVEALHKQSPFLPQIRNARIVRSDRRQFRVYEGGLQKGPSET